VAITLAADLAEGNEHIQTELRVSIPDIQKLLGDDLHPSIRANAIRALGTLCSPPVVAKTLLGEDFVAAAPPIKNKGDKKAAPVSSKRISDQNRETVTAGDGIFKILVASLRVESHMQTVGAALTTIGHLCYDQPRLQDKLLEAKPAAVIVSHLSDPSMEIQLAAMQAIRGLLYRASPSTSNQDTFRRVGAIYRVVMLIINGGTDTICDFGLQTLQVIGLENPINQDLIFGAIGAEPLLRCATSPSDSLQLSATRLILQLSSQKAKHRRDAMCEAGIRERLRVVREVSQHDLIRHTADAAFVALSK